MPRIDQIVNSTSGCKILSFLDAYSGYHQITMKESDQLATSFITLKNIGATYQRCMQQCFIDQIDPLDWPDQAERPKPTIAVYVDDMVVKTAQARDLIVNLATTFMNLQRFNIKLNPEKCVFGVPKGKLLGYIISERGIKANPKKIVAISNMGPIHNVKGVQRLTGCLAALSRFISRLGEWGMPLYKLLKKMDTFVWTEEAQQALESLKASLTSAPILIVLKRGEPLLLYVAASNLVVSITLVVEREEPGHHLKV